MTAEHLLASFDTLLHVCYNRGMLKRVRRLLRIIKYAVTQPKCFTLYLIKAEALEHLRVFNKIGVGSTEEIQDLIFHIDSYIELPQVLRNTIYEPYLKKGEKIDEYFEELEHARAVERDYIFELAKKLPIGFEL
jgi:hypothetical protein